MSQPGVVANVVAVGSTTFLAPILKEYTAEYPLELIDHYYGAQFLSLGEVAYWIVVCGVCYFGVSILIAKLSGR